MRKLSQPTREREWAGGVKFISMWVGDVGVIRHEIYIAFVTDSTSPQAHPNYKTSFPNTTPCPSSCLTAVHEQLGKLGRRTFSSQILFPLLVENELTSHTYNPLPHIHAWHRE